MRGRLGALVVVVAAMGCGSRPAGLPECRWDPSLDQADAAAGSCLAGRTLLDCTLSNGTSEGCLSDDLAGCPGASSQQDAVVVSCENQCAGDEYAVGCWARPMMAELPSPPVDCRSVAATPGGSVFYCCPCH